RADAHWTSHQAVGFHRWRIFDRSRNWYVKSRPGNMYRNISQILKEFQRISKIMTLDMGHNFSLFIVEYWYLLVYFHREFNQEGVDVHRLHHRAGTLHRHNRHRNPRHDCASN